MRDARESSSYDSVALQYDRTFSSLKYRPREYGFIMRRIPGGLGRLLDFGCGNGILLKTLAPRIGEGIGIDSSEAMIRLASRSSLLTGNISFMHHSGQGLPFADCRFHAIISTFALSHSPVDEVLPEFSRVLAPGGKLLIVDRFAYGCEKPDIFSVTMNRLRSALVCACHPFYFRRLLKLVHMSAWKEIVRATPLIKVDDALLCISRLFKILSVKQINCTEEKATWGIDAIKSG